ncbi:hypothetical protein BDR07DRAFT_1479374 [Suillus spraguei]|nr:hypothetical protein BDR07DRAFT_1479374 [Suillus spraguei]
MTKAFKSAEFVDTDSDIMELSSLSSESDLDESSGSTAIAEQALRARDSIDQKTVNASKQPHAEVTEEPALSESLASVVITYNILIFPDFMELFERNSHAVKLPVDGGIVDSNKAVL